MQHELSAAEWFVHSLADRWDPDADPDTSLSLPPVPDEWRDPVYFVEQRLRHRTWDIQRRILRDVLTVPSAQVAIKACHSSSKTFTAADCVIDWLVVQRGKCIITGPKHEQVLAQLWAEVRETMRTVDLGVPPPFKGSWELGPQVWARPMTTDEAVNFEGWHGKFLIVLDEGRGVDGALFGPIEGARSGADVRVLMQSNPITVGGPYHEAFRQHRAAWNTITISAFDTPNLRGLIDRPADDYDDEHLRDLVVEWAERTMRDEGLSGLQALRQYEQANTEWPMLCLRSWVYEMFLKYELGDPELDGRVFARFPTKDTSALVPLAWAERAGRAATPDPDLPIEAGVDVAGPGEDETVVYIRQGGHVRGPWSFRGDARGEVLACLREQAGTGLKWCKVDTVWGWYFAQHLYDHGVPVVPVNVGRHPLGVNPVDEQHARDDYDKLRDQLYWVLRSWFRENRVTGLTDAETVGQVTSIRYGRTPTGKRKIEPKVDLKKRTGGKSPDRAEALMLAFAPAELLAEPEVEDTWLDPDEYGAFAL